MPFKVLRIGRRVRVAMHRSFAMGILISAFSVPLFGQTPFLAGIDDTLFQRPTLPSQCMRAYTRLNGEVRWGEPVDTMIFNPNPPVNSRIVASMRRCHARLDGVAARAEPMAMARLLYAVGEVDSTWMYLARIRAGLPPFSVEPTFHGQVMLDALQIMLRTPPFRVGEVDRLMRSIDSLPLDTTRQRMYAHQTRFIRAVEMGDRATMVREANAFTPMFAAWLKSVRPDHQRIPEQKEFLIHQLSMLAEAEAVDSGFDAALVKLEQRAKIALGAQSAETLKQYRVFGTHPPRLADSAFVLDAHGKIVSVPVPAGKPTLMLFLISCPPWYGRSICITANAIIRRLYAQYKDSVEFIGVARTVGELHGELILDREKERAAIAEYHLKTVKLPIKLIIEDMAFTRRPDPDRRVVYTPTLAGQVYGKLYGGFIPMAISVVDRAGVTSNVYGLDQFGEALIRPTLTSVLGRGEVDDRPSNQ